MSRFEQFRKMLTEMPFVGPEDKMDNKKLSIMSIMSLKREWKLFWKNENFQIYKRDTTFIAGKLRNNEFVIYSELSTSVPSKHAPTFIKNSLQVDMVDTVEEFQSLGYAKQLYKQIIKKYTLISDTEQYKASKNLWKSIAREPDVFVYIWNDSNNSFILDDQQKPKRYNGINIIEEEIFGNQDKHHKIVLVATNKERN